MGISRRTRALLVLLSVTTAGACSRDSGEAVKPADQSLVARVVATGIPGAGPLTVVGTFLPGGPIKDNPTFNTFTEPGRVLEPTRVLVGSASNYGAPKAVADDMAGSLLSIDPGPADPMEVPADFGASGEQAGALNGRVQLYSGQSPAFVNSVKNPQAATAGFPGVSNILDLSINNAFGRLWPANAPRGLDRPGTSTILDPAGMPLAGAPNAQSGGVFAGSMTNRQPAQIVPGAVSTGAVGTAFLGRAIDDPRRAVFAVVTADGAVAQAHTEKGVDGLAPTGTISDLRGRTNSAELHVGAVVRYYSADPVLLVSDPVANEVVALTLPKDETGGVRKLGAAQRFRSEAFDMPVDLAPTMPEMAHRDWSSNTTLAELADIYVLNRGNNTITRMKVDGTVIATRPVALAGGAPLGPAKVNGIATSLDGTKIYVSVTGRLPGYAAEGALLELPAFSS